MKAILCVPLVFFLLPSVALGGTELGSVVIIDSEQLADGETELAPTRDCDPAITAIYQVRKAGIHWYEAEDADGNRYVVTNVVGTISTGKGVVDLGDGTGGKVVAWQGNK